ncbi:MAG: hypothetical protein AB7I50_21150, partial [Vicinamibacterales bacterium]
MTMYRAAALLASASALAFATTVFAASGKRPADAQEFAPVSTPPGITLQPMGLAQGYTRDKESATFLPRDQIVYADARGMTLYTRDADPLGKSTCVDECAKTWIPALADPKAKVYGEWSLVTRDDGAVQFAFKGKPLYTYIKDVDVGSVGSNSPARYGRGKNIGERGSRLAVIPDDVPMPEGWQPAFQYPLPLDAFPVGIGIKEVDDAAGLVLVNGENRTLYAFTGDLAQEKKLCGAYCPWKPLPAPQLAAGKGDFVSVARPDGIRQWTYKGLGLYTYSGDLAPGDAAGDGQNAHFIVAHLQRNYMPPEVSVQVSRKLGKVLATAQGQSLYRRDVYIRQSGSGQIVRWGFPVRPAVGRDRGVYPRCGS